MWAGARWDPSGGILPDTGARSKYYGQIQQRHQEWLTRKVEAHQGAGIQYTAGGEPSNTSTVAVGATETSEMKERIRRASIGVDLWGDTYVPPIEPVRRQGLINKWLAKTWAPPQNGQVRVSNSFCFPLLSVCGTIIVLLSFGNAPPTPGPIIQSRYRHDDNNKSAITAKGVFGIH